MLVVRAACLPEDRTTPYAPIVELLHARDNQFAPDTDRRPEGTAAAAPVAPHTDLLLPLVGDVDGGVDRPRGLAQAILQSCSDPSGRPAPIVLDDLHWSDVGSLATLLSLARRLASTPLLVVATYRPDEADAHLTSLLASASRERLVDEIVVPPLSPEAVAALIASLLNHQRPVHPALVAGVNALAEGNPFFIEELAAALPPEPAASNALAAAPLRLPRSLQAAVLHAVAPVSPAAREVLRLAAVAGRQFDVRLLQRLIQLDEPALLARVRELTEARLLVEQSRDRFTFRHAPIREAVCGELLARERLLLHRAVAEEAEQLYASALDAYLPDLARHFAAAEVWDKALVYARRAGDQAGRMDAPLVAVEQYGHALEAARRLRIESPREAEDVLTPLLPALCRGRGQAHERLGDFDRARADYEDAELHAQAVGDQRTRWETRLDLGLLWSGSDYAIAGGYVHRVLDLARRLDDPRLIARAVNRAGNWRVNTGEPRDALPLHPEALALFDPSATGPASRRRSICSAWPTT